MDNGCIVENIHVVDGYLRIHPNNKGTVMMEMVLNDEYPFLREMVLMAPEDIYDLVRVYVQLYFLVLSFDKDKDTVCWKQDSLVSDKRIENYKNTLCQLLKDVEEEYVKIGPYLPLEPEKSLEDTFNMGTFKNFVANQLTNKGLYHPTK